MCRRVRDVYRYFSLVPCLSIVYFGYIYDAVPKREFYAPIADTHAVILGFSPGKLYNATMLQRVFATLKGRELVEDPVVIARRYFAEFFAGRGMQLNREHAGLYALLANRGKRHP